LIIFLKEERCASGGVILIAEKQGRKIAGWVQNAGLASNKITFCFNQFPPL
jgi:hypothetical protein